MNTLFILDWLSDIKHLHHKSEVEEKNKDNIWSDSPKILKLNLEYELRRENVIEGLRQQKQGAD